jgi:hypothetical protein
MICSVQDMNFFCDACFSEGTKKLKPNLTDELDFTLVPKAAWERLVCWYGLAEGQVCITFKCVVLWD